MKPSVILPLAALLGILVSSDQAFAQNSVERPRQFRQLPPEDRRPPGEQFRPQRPQNLERFMERREEMRARAIERARQADTNHDGAISRQEAERSMPHLSKHFDEVDANHDGVVTRDEVRAFRERRMQQRLERGRSDPRF